MTEPDEARLWAILAADHPVLGPAYRAGAAASEARIKAGDLVAWLEKHPELELSWGDVGDVSECNWRVHARHGGINDREWRLVDVGHTPTEALTNALALLKEADRE